MHFWNSKSWKMMLWKCCIQYASKFGKLSSGHRTGKGQFSFQTQGKAMPKNIQATAQLHSSHTSKVMLKIFQVRLQQLGAKWGSQVRLQQNQEFQILKLELERQRNQRPNCQHLLDDRKSKGIPEKTLEKEMTTHSSILAWKIPGIEEPGRLQSMGLQRVRHNWVTSLSRKTSTSALLTTPKPLCGSQQTVEYS